MIENTSQYCEWVGYQSDILLYLFNLGLGLGAAYGFWQARKTKEFLFPLCLLALLTLRLTSTYILNLNIAWIETISLLTLSFGFAWIYFKNITSNYQRGITGIALIFAVLIALNTFASIEHYRLYLWLLIALNVLFGFAGIWRRIAALAICSIWLLVPAQAPDPALCTYFNAMWSGFSIVCLIGLISLSPKRL